MSHQVRHLYEFGPFRLDPEKPCLWRDGEPISLTPKAVETLIVLVQQSGKLVERERLMNAIWPNTFVEDGNLNFNVSVLRKALGTDAAGEQYIQTIPRRGYRFNADVREVAEEVPVLMVEKHTRARVVIEERVFPTDPEPALEKAALPPGLSPRKYQGIYAAGAVALLVAIGAVTWVLLTREVTRSQPGGVAAQPIQSIAVLPLKPLSNEDSDGTLSLGLTDTLVTRLGSLRSIVVRPVSNPGAAPDAIEIGRKLKVDAVLEATLQRTSSRLRINARLVRVGDGALLWSASFDEDETDLFKLQDALSLQVTQSLGARLNPKETELLTRRDTQHRGAFHVYWRGRLFLEKRKPEKAIAEFQQAINLDPNYALAYAGLADAYIWQASFTSDADTELYVKAKSSTDKALELDPNLADAHSSLARIKYQYDWDWAGAEKSFRRAIELNPNSVNAHQFYARLLATMGRYEEGLAEIHKARELDPRSADLGVPLYGILEKQGAYDEALKVLQSTLEMDNDSQFARRGTGKLYLLKNDYAKVIELGNELFPHPKEPDFAWASMLATAYHKTGQINMAAEMRNRLKKMAEKDPKSLYFLALHYSELGRTDEAIAALQKCLELREDRMIWTKDEPRFSAIKDDPRFQEILQKLNLAS